MTQQQPNPPAFGYQPYDPPDGERQKMFQQMDTQFHQQQLENKAIAIVVLVGLILGLIVIGAVWRRRKIIADKSLSTAATAFVATEKVVKRTRSRWHQAVDRARDGQTD
jgi:hypothetical protein